MSFFFFLITETLQQQQDNIKANEVLSFAFALFYEGRNPGKEVKTQSKTQLLCHFFFFFSSIALCKKKKNSS